MFHQTKVIPINAVTAYDDRDLPNKQDNVKKLNFDNVETNERSGTDISTDTMAVSWMTKTKTFAGSISIVGVSNVVKENTPILRRVIWMTLILAGLVFMGYQVTSRILYYLTNPTMVEISSTYKQELRFPTVTICNENTASREAAMGIPGLIGLLEELHPKGGSSFDPEDAMLLNVTQIYSNYSDVISKFHPQYGLMWKSISPFYDYPNNIRSIAWSYFNGLRCTNAVSEMFSLISTDLGYCVQLNGVGDNYTSRMAGSPYGLKLVLNASQSDYLINPSGGSGFRVLLHDQGDLPLMEKHGFKISTGMITSVSVKLQTVQNLPAPYGNCSEEEGYTYKQCLFQCENDYVIERCGCRFFYYTDRPNASVCDPVEEVYCAKVKASEFIETKAGEARCYCPPQCNTNNYQYTISSQFLSQQVMASRFSGAALIEKARQDITILNIYFDELLHEQVRMEPVYTLLCLLCEIGGAMGLVLGATIMTLAEVVDFGVDLLYQLLKYHLVAKEKQQDIK